MSHLGRPERRKEASKKKKKNREVKDKSEVKDMSLKIVLANKRNFLIQLLIDNLKGKRPNDVCTPLE